MEIVRDVDFLKFTQIYRYLLYIIININEYVFLLLIRVVDGVK